MSIPELDSHRPSGRVWMWVTVLICTAIAASWVPALGLPLGDDHQGRILGRLVLQADNFLARGWEGSNYVADWRPYSALPYAHHPPLVQFIHAAVAWIQGGATALGARMVAYAGGTLGIGLVVIFVRRLAGSWLASAAAVGGLAVSGMFWLFGRSLGLLLIAAFFLIHLIARQRPGRLVYSLLFTVALLGTMQAWQGAFVIGLLAIYDFATGNRKQSLVIWAGVALGFVLDLWWIETAAGISALSGHLEARAQAADYRIAEWIQRQRTFLLRFETLPVVLLTLAATITGLVDRRFRPYLGASLLSVIVFAVVFHPNAWVHEYWNWRLSLILAFGMAAIGAWIHDRFSAYESWQWAVAIVVLAMAVVPVLRLGSDLYAIQYVESAKAGALVERNEFPPEQDVAWHYGGLSSPRWYAWYSDLSVRQLDPANPPTPDSLVLVKRRSDDDLGAIRAIETLGSYSLVRTGDLVSGAEQHRSGDRPGYASGNHKRMGRVAKQVREYGVLSDRQPLHHRKTLKGILSDRRHLVICR